VAVVAPVGTAAVHSGKQVLASHWAGSRSGATYAIAGNGLVGESVLLAMEEAFQRVQGDLPARLLAALEAAEAAGGQTTGAMSAALLVRTRAGGFADTDLRVDAAATPVAELRRLFGLRQAHGAMLAAESAARAGRSLEATRLIEEALRLGNSWDRIWRRAARTAMSIREPAAALGYLRGFRARNAAWWRLEIEDDLYSPLRDEPEMQRWRSDQAEP
jgi:hypothetical protein